MAKRNRKRKNEAADWLAEVQKRPSAFDHWRQLSWRLPLQPKRKKAMSAYADRQVGVFMILAAVVLLLVVVTLAIVQGIGANYGKLCLPGGLFLLVEIGLVKVGLDHIRYAAE